MASASPPPAASSAAARGHRPIVRRLLHLTRTLHTYVTMLGLILLIFFSFTGFILNNAGSVDDSGKLFSLNKTITNRSATVPTSILSGKEHLFAIEHYLRDHLGARGEISATPDEDDTTIRFQFVGPGREANYEITRATGATKIEEQRGILAAITDLHTGQHAGHVWNYFIDATAIFLFFAAISGLILWISLPKRRTLGLIALVRQHRRLRRRLSVAGAVSLLGTTATSPEPRLARRQPAGEREQIVPRDRGSPRPIHPLHE